MLDYSTFLAAKEVTVPPAGFEVARADLNPALFEWQKDIVVWALKRGRAAMFEDTGLGKTPQQLVWAEHMSQHTEMPSLVLTRLAVAEQTQKLGARFGIPVRLIESQADVLPGINVTNYEKLHLLDPDAFGSVILDESSLLKAYMGVTKWKLVRAFARVPYRLVCTATPAPNEYEELLNQAEFLGIMEAGEALTRWFIHNTKEGRDFRLKGHAEADFWRWVSTWAACVSKPSDLLDADGRPYLDDGFILPPLTFTEHIVGVDHTDGDGVHLFRLSALSPTELHKEMRKTAPDRARKAAEIVLSNPEEPAIVWCNTDYEADALKALLPTAVEVRGSDSEGEKRCKLAAFTEGLAPYIITKPTLAGFGLNWQHCRRVIFVGPSYSFEAEYQALRRSWRFGQTRPVEAHLIMAETETAIAAVVAEKQQAHGEMQDKMRAAMRETMLDQRRDLAVVAGPAFVTVERGPGWELYLGDCVEVTRQLPADNFGFSIFSPPFSTLYTYSPSLRDMGNCEGDDHFFEHFAYLLPELWRVMIPGRLVAVHVKNLPIYKSHEGYSGIRDFRGDVIRAFTDLELPGGRWAYHSEVCIWTDPVKEMQRTKAQGLLYSQLKRDGSYSRQGMAEYLLLFRKWTPDCATLPVTHDEDELPLDLWQKLASPVWFDIKRMNVLNAEIARADKDEKHLAPLQLDVIARAVKLWSNPGDIVFTPFAGVGSEVYGSLLENRRGCGIELKQEYWELACRHANLAVMQKRQGTLFDLAQLEEARTA